MALASFVEEDRVHAALDAGAAGYLRKDVDRDLLDRLRGNCPQPRTPPAGRLLRVAMIAFDVISRIVTTRNPTGDYGKALRALRSRQPQELQFTRLPAIARSPFHRTAGCC